MLLFPVANFGVQFMMIRICFLSEQSRFLITNIDHYFVKITIKNDVLFQHVQAKIFCFIFS